MNASLPVVRISPSLSRKSGDFQVHFEGDIQLEVTLVIEKTKLKE
jgi:hypothetical protein